MTSRKPGPHTPDGWKARYVEEIRTKGGFYRAAKQVGVDYDTALRERDRDPAFEKACHDARQEYADDLELQMVEDSHLSGNPAGQIVRLKALRPQEYIEKHAVLTLTADLSELPVDDARQLLKSMLGGVTPSTTKMLSDGA